MKNRKQKVIRLLEILEDKRPGKKVASGGAALVPAPRGPAVQGDSEESRMFDEEMKKGRQPTEEEFVEESLKDRIKKKKKKKKELQAPILS